VRGYSVVLVLLAWEALGRSGLVPGYFLPTLTTIASRGASDLASGTLLAATLATLYRMLVAYAAAIVVGVPLGVAMARVASRSALRPRRSASSRSSTCGSRSPTSRRSSSPRWTACSRS
jgi:ABC-type nitrate/sulfonate/bicarbonate transport system permease component